MEFFESRKPFKNRKVRNYSKNSLQTKLYCCMLFSLLALKQEEDFVNAADVIKLCSGWWHTHTEEISAQSFNRKFFNITIYQNETTHLFTVSVSNETSKVTSFTLEPQGNSVDINHQILKGSMTFTAGPGTTVFGTGSFEEPNSTISLSLFSHTTMEIDVFARETGSTTVVRLYKETPKEPITLMSFFPIAVIAMMLFAIKKSKHSN